MKLAKQNNKTKRKQKGSKKKNIIERYNRKKKKSKKQLFNNIIFLYLAQLIVPMQNIFNYDISPFSRFILIIIIFMILILYGI